jgi:hypothetical protein
MRAQSRSLDRYGIRDLGRNFLRPVVFVAKARQSRKMQLPSVRRQSGYPNGNRAMREAAGQERVEVRGALWVVEQVLVAGLITVERAGAAYAAMRAHNSCLPWDLVEEKLERWRQSAAGQAPHEAGQELNPVP